MKKKLLPFILGCTMVAAMPFAAHAEDDYWADAQIQYANETPTGGGAAGSTGSDESQNGFTEYNDTEATENTLAQTFGASGNASTLGNTRGGASDIQNLYAVDLKNETQDYRSSDTATTLSQDIASNSFNEETNDSEGVTDLETSVPEYTMTIPASTVLPVGTTRWRIGNVKINGSYFVRPDKVQLTVTKQNFHHSDFDTTKEESDSSNTNKVIAFDVTDRRYSNNTIVGAGHETYFFQDGTKNNDGTANNTSIGAAATFPYAYTGYVSGNYENGYVSDINETHQVWVLPATGAWANKLQGKYTGSITFMARIVTTDANNMYGQGNYYPAEGAEPNS